MKRLLKKWLLFAILLCYLGAGAQETSVLNLETCYNLADRHYPMTRQYELLNQSEQFTVSNAGKAGLPQFSLSLRAGWQSEVTEIPSSLSAILSQLSGKEVQFAALPQDQYQAVAEAGQLIWAGGSIQATRQASKAEAEVGKHKLDVELYVLRERISQLYFGILLLKEQQQQTSLMMSELEVHLQRLQSLAAQGMAQAADLDVIRVEQLQLRQRQTTLQSNEEAYRLMLSAFIAQKVDASTILEVPSPSLPPVDALSLKRPELSLFESQSRLLDTRQSLLLSATRPRLSAFLQAGYGQPGLNMFKDGFSAFYLGGLRLNWNLSAFYTLQNNLGTLEVGRKEVQLQRETFLFQTNLDVIQQKSEIERLQSIINQDDEIIRLRVSLKEVAAARVEYGTMTATDLVREINALDQARMQRSLHGIQYLMAVYQLKTITNN